VTDNGPDGVLFHRNCCYLIYAQHLGIEEVLREENPLATLEILL